MILGKKKAWSITAMYPDYMISTVQYADTLPKAFKKFAKLWHVNDVQEISITEVMDDERSKGISGADQMA